MIVLPEWLEDVFGDGRRPEPRRRYRNYLTIRISAERKARYERAAAKAKETLSAWVKRLLDRASK